MTAPSSTSQTGAAQSHSHRLGAAARRYTSTIAAFVGAAGWGVAQLAEGWSTFREWRAQMGLWPVIALVAIGILAAHGVRVLQLLAAINTAIAQLTSRDAQHDGAIAELRADLGALKKRLDDTGPHPLQAEASLR